MTAGHEVAVVARGDWAKTLREDGLRIHHYVQRRDTVDDPRVLERPDNEAFDIVFAVMQYGQMGKIIPDLAAVRSPIVVLTSNNLSAADMEARILAQSTAPRTVLFAFGSTAGTRENGRLTTVHMKNGKITIRKLNQAVPQAVRAVLEQVFSRLRLSVDYCDNMDAWLKYHAAFILPVVYLCYASGCDLRNTTHAQRRELLDAAADAYHLLMALGYPVRPEGDEKMLEAGRGRWVACMILYAVSRTRLGALCTTEHCRHAPGEMAELDRAFQKIRAQKCDMPMPAFGRLHQAMPSWEIIRCTYAQQSGK